MSTAHAAGTPEWLQDTLVKLLNAPHISFPKPTGALAHIRKEVDHEGLKEALLRLQKKWQADAAKFSPQASVENSEHPIVTVISWSPRNFNKDTAEVKASAAVREEGGATRISSLSLEGDAELFA
ncbi:unnamed protein product [Somion occarium]|uniref:Uncharacterized protein n=1 Tax=Somion occarium TaxID=3059160 RepID=A0ABP1CGK8_9APHY